jgi:hypothetical protein
MKFSHANGILERHTSVLKLCFIGVVIVASTGCMPLFYLPNSTTAIDKETVSGLIKQQKYFVLHITDMELQKGIHDISLKDDTIKGIMVDLPIDHTKNLQPDPKKEKNRLGTNAQNRRIGLTEVHLYTSSKNATDSILVLPLSSIKRMDVYEINEQATRQSRVTNIVALTVCVVGVPLLLYAMAASTY